MTGRRGSSPFKDFLDRVLPVDEAAEALVDAYAAERQKNAERRPIPRETRALADFREALEEQRATFAARPRLRIEARTLQELRGQNLQMAAYLLAGVEAIDAELERRQKERDEANRE